MTTGRPTKYNEEMLEKAIHYVDNYIAYGDKVPSIEGLAVTLEVAKPTLYDWGKAEGNEAFSYTLQKLKEKQARIILNNGLDGTFNSTIAKLMLSNHGYREKSEVENKNTQLNVDVEFETAEEASRMYQEIVKGQ